MMIIVMTRLSLDGRPAEMPLALGEDTTVTREGSLVRINNRHGVSVTCDLPHDRCSVQVSGWYFGKTAGERLHMRVGERKKYFYVRNVIV